MRIAKSSCPSANHVRIGRAAGRWHGVKDLSRDVPTKVSRPWLESVV